MSTISDQVSLGNGTRNVAGVVSWVSGWPCASLSSTVAKAPESRRLPSLSSKPPGNALVSVKGLKARAMPVVPAGSPSTRSPPALHEVSVHASDCNATTCSSSLMEPTRSAFTVRAMGLMPSALMVTSSVEGPPGSTLSENEPEVALVLPSTTPLLRTSTCASGPGCCPLRSWPEMLNAPPLPEPPPVPLGSGIPRHVKQALKEDSNARHIIATASRFVRMAAV